MRRQHSLGLTVVLSIVLASLSCSRQSSTSQDRDESVHATATDIPKPKDVLTLANKTIFSSKPAPERSTEAKVEVAPRAKMLVYFTEDEMTQLHPMQGAIVAKLDITGVPPVYQIPDGSHYLWIGRVNGSTRAVLTKTDGSTQTEVMIGEAPADYSSGVVESAPNLTGASVPLPQPLPNPPKPPPPIRWKYITKKVCYNPNGKTVWTVERVCVPEG